MNNIIQVRRGLKQTLPNGNLGEPLYQTDTKELFIGNGPTIPPTKINGVNTFIQSVEPLAQKAGDIWLNTQDNDNYALFIKGDNTWLTYSQGGSIGDTSQLLTSHKNTIVDSINELYSTLFGNVYNFILSNIDSGNKIKQSWTNPKNQEFNKRILFMSETINLSSYTYEELNELLSGGNISVLTEGVGSGFGNDDFYIIDSIVGNHYYFKIFTEFNVQNVIFRDEGLSLDIISKDETPPANIGYLNQTQLNESILLTWENPSDSDFQGIKIIRKIGNYPTNENDVLNNKVVTLTGGETSYLDENLMNNVTYYYWFFPYDTTNNYNTEEYNRISTYPTQFSIPDCKNLKAESVNQGKNVNLTWTNPANDGEKIFWQREIFFSEDSSLLYKSRTECNNDNSVIKLELLQGTGQGNSDIYVHDTSSYIHGTKLYYKIFQQFQINSKFYYSNGVNQYTILIDNMPPENQTILNVETFENYVKFNINDSSDNDWVGCYIVRRYGTTPPINIEDGEISYVNTVKNLYQTNKFSDTTNLQINVPYTYKLFPFDLQGNINYTSSFTTVTLSPDEKQVSNFVQTTPVRNTVKLTWENPTISNFENWSETIIVRNTTNIPQNVDDGQKIFNTTDRNITSYNDIGMIIGPTYYYRAFTKDSSDVIYDESIRSQQQIPYKVIPQNLKESEMIVGSNYIQFRWDETLETGWQKTKIIRNYNNYPQSHSDGFPIFTNIEQIEKYKNLYYIDQTLVDGDNTQAWHGIFPGDSFDSFNINTVFEKTGYENRLNTNLNSILSIENGTKININQTTPQQSYETGTFAYIQIFESQNVNIQNMTFQECYNDERINLLTKLSQQQSKTYDIVKENTTVGNTYYFKMFSMYLKNGIYYVSDGIYFLHKAIDTTQPGNVSNIVLSQGDKEIYIQWNDPVDLDWNGTKLFRSSIKTPESITDSDQIQIYESKIRNEYSQQSKHYFIDSEVENGITYYYRLFPYDSSGNINQTSPLINSKSIQAYINGIEEVDGEITKFNLTQTSERPVNLDIKLTESNEFLQNSQVDILKLDTTNQQNDSIKTLQQFSPSESDIFEYNSEYLELTDEGLMQFKTKFDIPLTYYSDMYDSEGNPIPVFKLDIETLKTQHKKVIKINNIIEP